MYKYIKIDVCEDHLKSVVSGYTNVVIPDGEDTIISIRDKYIKTSDEVIAEDGFKYCPFCGETL